jgi:hypothetical protein
MRPRVICHKPGEVKDVQVNCVHLETDVTACATTDHSVSRDVRHQCLALGRTALVMALQSPITKTVLAWAPFGCGFGELSSRKCVALHTTADFGLPRASSARANETHCSEILIASSASSYTRPKGIRST